jgi:hypothetical protein
MKKTLIALFIMVPLLSVAKEKTNNVYNKPVQCFDAKLLFNTIETEYKEKLVFFYPNSITNNKTAVIMLSNGETGSWTLIETDKTIACVLATGKNTPT